MVNFHTHTFWCDGSNTTEEFVLYAIDEGFKQIGFSSHAPIPLKMHWTLMSHDKVVNYVSDVRKLANKYTNIDIICGLEADYIQGITRPFEELMEEYKLDYIIGAVHLVRVQNHDKLFFIDGNKEDFYSYISKYLNNDGKKACLLYYEQLIQMIETQKFDILAHFDKIKMNNANKYFNEEDHWYQDIVGEVLRLIKKKGIILEVNTRGLYKGKIDDFFPSKWIIVEAVKMGIPLLVQSDAHKVQELKGGMNEAYDFFREINYYKKFEWNKEKKKFELLSEQ